MNYCSVFLVTDYNTEISPNGEVYFSYDIDLGYVTLEMKSVVIRWTIVSH